MKYAYYILTVILICIFIYIIRKVLLKRNKKEHNEPKICELFYFFTAWCPYCKKARIEWDKFKLEWNYKMIDGYTLKFQEIDCDMNEPLATKYNVTNYPTIKLIKDDIVIDYDAKPNVESLTRFLTTSFE
jgi:thiol-disulfide isomerase/thioredoxin